MKTCVVIGGGRWGRILEEKFSKLGFGVRVATEFPNRRTDIRRAELASLAPALIYVASRSTDHERDFEAAAGLGIPIWVEKNFSVISTLLRERFLAGDNVLFNQQLFNTSIDQHATLLAKRTDFVIETEVDRPIWTQVGLYDWIGHDLALIARLLWLRGVSSSDVSCEIEYSPGRCTARIAVAQIDFVVVLRESSVRRRRVPLDDGAVLWSARDGVLRHDPYGVGGDQVEELDLLQDSLQVALRTSVSDQRRLTALSMALNLAVYPNLPQLIGEHQG